MVFRAGRGGSTSLRRLPGPPAGAENFALPLVDFFILRLFSALEREKSPKAQEVRSEVCVEDIREKEPSRTPPVGH